MLLHGISFPCCCGIAELVVHCVSMASVCECVLTDTLAMVRSDGSHTTSPMTLVTSYAVRRSIAFTSVPKEQSAYTPYQVEHGWVTI